MKAGLSLYCNGSNRKRRKLVQDIVMEGENPMTLQIYKYLTLKFFESDKKEHIFDHIFLV